MSRIGLYIGPNNLIYKNTKKDSFTIKLIYIEMFNEFLNFLIQM